LIGRTQVRGIVAGVVAGALLGLGAAFILVSGRPAEYEFDAFVTLPIFNGDLLAPRDETVDNLNGFSFAARVAEDLGDSPWSVWRSFTVLPEGRTLTIRSSHSDRASGERRAQAAQRRAVEILNESFETVIGAQRTYRESLETQLRDADAGRGRNLGSVAAADGGRELVRARLERELRDVRVIEARSQPARAVAKILSRGTDLTTRRRLYLTTGTAAGMLVGLLLAGLSLRGQW
jgi:hypothetical protein